MFRIILIGVLLVNFVYAGKEDKIKSMLIGRVSSLIKWPDGHKADEFTIGVFGKSNISQELKKIYAKKKIKKKKVIIKEVKTEDDFKTSDIIYIAKASSSQIKKIVGFSKKYGVLTVSDSKGFIDKGGVIQFFTVSKKVKLKINNTTAKSSKITIKPILLKLAKDVK